ncbi:hypothetical protein BTO30_11875 [Domibacillus antri]|uniref:TerD domain-containing protein n=1 Tax=Domibacillus antri TaxID=1714264 RepID=A0A1Q8Q422_9BACI|nr:TerD family protein [Domibacillus antri]OLN22021.1 hypothetical protein BTO30_11875 [Domibacillus antri]
MIKLVKGQKVDLTKQSSIRTSIRLGLGWDISKDMTPRYDLDIVALLVDDDGVVRSPEHIVFYNQLTALDGAVVLSNDNQTGAGTGDDEELFLQLSHVPGFIDKVVAAIVVHDADERGQTFGEMKDAFVRIVNEDTKQEMYRYELGKDFAGETAIVAGEVYRTKNGWVFSALGKSIDGGLFSLCREYGINELPASFFTKKEAMTKLSPLHVKKPFF